MPIELPFSVDTIEAFQEADGSGELLLSVGIRVIPFAVYLICAILEFVSYNVVFSQLDASCIEYFEISDAAALFLTLSYMPVFPDAIFAILGPLSFFMLYNNPYSVCYDGTTGILGLSNGIIFFARMTFCGNPAQSKMILGPLLEIFCGLFHIGNAVLGHMSFTYLDKEGELYFGRIEDFIEDMKG